MVNNRLRLAFVLLLSVGFVSFLAWPTAQVNQYKGRTKVRYWHMWTGEWQVVIDRIVKAFNDSQDEYEVVALSIPWTVGDTKPLLGIAGGDPPDVMTHWASVVPSWAAANWLTPMDEVMTPAEIERFKRETYPVALQVGTYHDRVYGVSVGLNAFGLFYLPQHFREVGLDPDKFPATLEELAEASHKLTKFDSKGNLVRLGFLPSNFLSLSESYGGGLYDWKAGKLTINTPQNLRALQYIVDERKKIGFDKVLRFNSGLDTGSFAGGWPFIGGALSCTFDGQWRVEQIGKFAPNLEYRTIPVPPPQGGIPLAGTTNGNFMIIPKGAKEKKGALAFIKFWSGMDDPERAAKFYTWGGWLPLTDRVAKAKDYQAYLHKYPQFATFITVLASPNYTTAPPVAYQQFLTDRANRAEDLAVRGTMTPAQALKNLEQEVIAELQRRKDLGYDE
ncbi:MAG: ABC transporter substrate-binding protein [Fimbriimonas sp.]